MQLRLNLTYIRLRIHAITSGSMKNFSLDGKFAPTVARFESVAQHA